MNLNKTNLFLTILFVFLFAPILAISQTNNGNELSKAIQLFDNGKFEAAETMFKKILDEKPDDFMVNFFYGACRTENNHFTVSDLDCLIKANQEVSPINIDYYFGVQYHARSNWERALKFYNKYASTATLTESEKQKLLELIQQCNDKINPYKEYMIRENSEGGAIIIIDSNSIEVDSFSENEIKMQDTLLSNNNLLLATDPIVAASETETTPPTGEAIQFIINDEITYLNTSHFKTEEGKILFEKGDSLQKVLDLTIKRLDGLRENYSSAKSREEKKSIGEKILILESELYLLKSDATQSLIDAKTTENKYWENAAPNEAIEFIAELNQYSNRIENNEVIDKETRMDSTNYIDPNVLFENNDIISSPEESTNDDLIYKIQIGAFSRGIPSYLKKTFDKLSLIRKVETYTDEKGVVIYTTGNLSNYEDAVKMKNQVKQEGAEDATVVPYFSGKRITLEQAKKLEEKR